MVQSEIAPLMPARGVGVLYPTRESYFRIPPLAILTRAGGKRFKVFEAHYSDRIFREIDRIARDGETICGLIWDRRALDRSSIRALNCYLRVNGRVRWPNRLTHSHLEYGRHRWAFDSFCGLVGLRWEG